MSAPRGWAQREQMAPVPTGAYQAVCGHYVHCGVYACRECNTAPLSELLEARAEIERLRTVLDEIAAEDDE